MRCAERSRSWRWLLAKKKKKSRKHSDNCECEKCLAAWIEDVRTASDYPDCPNCGNNGLVDVLDEDAGTFVCMRCGYTMTDLTEGGEWVRDDMVEQHTKSILGSDRPIIGHVFEDTHD